MATLEEPVTREAAFADVSAWARDPETVIEVPHSGFNADPVSGGVAFQCDRGFVIYAWNAARTYSLDPGSEEARVDKVEEFWRDRQHANRNLTLEDVSVWHQAAIHALTLGKTSVGEHFATWCCTGRTASHQVRMTSSLTTSGAAATTAIGTTASVVGAIGSVAGLSGAGVMSGLATAGGYLGGGAAMGPLAIATIPATVSVGAVQVALRIDPSLPKNENDARRDGRVASVIGAGAAGAGGIVAISSAGATAGLSAAGISSGLAAIGSVLGGGMVAGTVAVAAAPAAAAGAVGFGIYVLSRKLRGVHPTRWEPTSFVEPDSAAETYGETSGQHANPVEN